MNPTNIHTLFFSPTGTSHKIADAVTQGISGKGTVLKIDLTHAPVQTSFAHDTVVVVAAPVYGGMIAPLALERMEGMRGDGTPAVTIVVYGNRDIGKAAVQLAEFLSERGFIPIAAGAFVGEHSYHSERTPIASGRPDASDLARAAAFGAAIRTKIEQGALTKLIPSKLKAPRTPIWPLLRFIRFVLRYRKEQKRHPIVLLPATDTARCTHCGRCAALCPSEAIMRGAEERTDPARCIRCNACVKGCPIGARSYDTPFAAALSESFARRKEPVIML